MGRVNLPDIAGEQGRGVRVLDWAFDPSNRAHYARVCTFVYSSDDRDFWYSTPVVVTDDEIDLYGKAAIARLVQNRLADAIDKVLGVRRATRRKFGINRTPRQSAIRA